MIYDHLEPGDKKLSEKSLFSVHCQGKLKCNEQAGEQSWGGVCPSNSENHRLAVDQELYFRQRM